MPETTARKKGRTGTPVKLVLAIVHSQAADRIEQELIDTGFPGPTRIDKVGGSLRHGNVTLLLGAEKERVEPLIEVVRGHTEAQNSTIFVLHSNRLLRV